jgi:hypothetical protein
MKGIFVLVTFDKVETFPGHIPQGLQCKDKPRLGAESVIPKDFS